MGWFHTLMSSIMGGQKIMDLSVSGWNPGFNVLRTGVGQYSVDITAESLKPTVGTVKTYYTDAVSGNNSNSGANEANALLNISTAITKADADIINVIAKPPADRIFWGARGTGGLSPTKNVILNTIDGLPAYVVKSIKPTWTLNATYANVYQAAAPTGVSNTDGVIDLRPRLVSGLDFALLTPVADLATVTATLGSFYHDTTAGVVYVRAPDDRNLIGDAYMTVPATGGNLSLNALVTETTSRTMWAGNLILVGGAAPCIATHLGNSGAPRMKIVFSKCGFYGSLRNANGMGITGAYDVIAFDCEGGLNSQDLYNTHSNTSGQCRMVNINAKGKRTGFNIASPAIANISTGHEDTITLNVNCDFSDSDGRVVAYIGTSVCMNFGGKVGPSRRTDLAGNSFQAGDTAKIYNYEVEVLPGTATYMFATDGGANIYNYGMDAYSGYTKVGNVSFSPLI